MAVRPRPQECCAVGGCVQPVNTFGLIAPWVAVVGLVGCIGTVVVVAKKRQSLVSTSQT
jgi:hypothetical protein